MEEGAGIGGLGEGPSLEAVTTAEKVAEEVVVVMEEVVVMVVVVAAAMGVMGVEVVHGIDVIS